MRNAAIALALILPMLLIGASPKRDFQQGKLLDISTEEEIIKGKPLKSVIFSVQIADLVYSARDGEFWTSNRDLGHGLIVGDPVQAAIDGSHLILLKPNGKEFKATIIKRERAH